MILMILHRLNYPRHLSTILTAHPPVTFLRVVFFFPYGCGERYRETKPVQVHLWLVGWLVLVLLLLLLLLLLLWLWLLLLLLLLLLPDVYQSKTLCRAPKGSHIVFRASAFSLRLGLVDTIIFVKVCVHNI